jgi:hypothetical protein
LTGYYCNNAFNCTGVYIQALVTTDITKPIVSYAGYTRMGSGCSSSMCCP